MRYDYETIGNVIRSLREQRRMTQEVLSGLAGVSRSHLSAIETGTRHANIETFARIAQALGLKLSELIAHAEEVSDEGGTKRPPSRKKSTASFLDKRTPK